jgi:threonine dehydratase
VAAYLFDKIDTSLKTVALVSGGNVDITTLARIIFRGMQKTGRIVRLATKMVDRADNLARLIQLVADDGANVLEVYHEREDLKTEVNSCTVTLTLETKDAEHIRKIRRTMVESGFPLLD